jgi:hypothetical protein
MERRINKKIDTYLTQFKEDVKNKTIELVSIDNNSHQLIQFICDYDNLNLDKEDFVKRKRVKNIVHLSERCCAKRASGEQCTRRRKDENSEYCGTHLKGIPHGVCNIEEDNNKPQGQKVDVWVQDIQGIMYYIDKNSNVYQVEDIIQGHVNPKIIAKYVKVGETYIIPEFNS